MLVDGSGQIKMTKDGKVLLSEMQIQVTIPHVWCAEGLADQKEPHRRYGRSDSCRPG